jgi:hypothetical protein
LRPMEHMQHARIQIEVPQFVLFHAPTPLVR